MQLSLVAGMPQTFVQQISQPYYARRPVVPLPQTAVLTPQTHDATLATGPGTLAGSVRDASGASLPGVRVLLRDGERQASAVTDARGEYRVTVPAGIYRVEFVLPGFNRVVVERVSVGDSISRQQDAIMRVGGLEETITVTGESPAAGPVASSRAQAGNAAGVGGGVSGGLAGGRPDRCLLPMRCGRCNRPPPLRMSVIYSSTESRSQ